MSSTVLNDECACELPFRSVNGSHIRLNNRSSSNINIKAKNVTKFVLSRDRSLNINASLFLLLVTLCLWKAFDTLIPFIVSVLALTLQFSAFITSVHKDTLIAIESVGIHIEGTRVCYGLNSCEFLPWDTVVDVFINEVITGQKVLYYLTIVVKESIVGKDTIRLVPLFRELIPERKCLEYIITQEEFAFGKDLMKIIRKIIKSKPRQGQQFGTRHLLVTYNHTSWTRQDKMFAMLKFKERANAGTVSHAFVLTIKVSSVMESVKCNVEHPMTTRSLNLQSKDSSNKYECKTEKSHINGLFASSTKKEHVQNNTQQKCEKVQEVINLENDNNHLNNTSTDSNWKKGVVNNKPIQEVANSIDTGCCSRKLNLRSEQSVRSEVTLVELNESKSLDEPMVRTKKRDGKHTVNNQDCSSLHSRMHDTDENILVARKSKRLRSPKVKRILEQEWFVTETDTTNNELSNNMDESFEIDTFSITDASDDPKNICHDNHGNSSDNSTFDEAGLDSANLPYQYLIEKEIENAKNKQVLSQIIPKEMKSNNDSNDEQSHKKRKLSEANEKDDKNSVNSIEVSETTKTQDSLTPKRKKYVSDRKTSRSSNITDLVMEGLMFTIRQGQDSVAVIEQKAKLEMDEVLENSEKVETKDGEKRLRNASLLRLENLVTMIELPKSTEGNKSHDATTNSETGFQFKPSVNSSLFSTTRENCLYSNKWNGQKKAGEVKDKLQWESSCHDNVLAGTSFANDNKNFDIRNRGKYSKVDGRVKGGEFAEDKMYGEEEEEDIIPEALQDEIFQNLTFTSENKTKSEELQSESPVTKKDTATGDANIETGRSSSGFSNSRNSITQSKTDKLVCETGATSKSKVNDKGNQGVNVPRVISSKTITMDQMPLRLQQVLRQKLIQQSIPLNNEITNPKVEEVQTPHKEKVVLDKQLTSQKTMYDTLENTSYVKQSDVSTECTDKLKHTESISSLISKTEPCNDNVSQDKSKLQEDETNVRVTSEERMELPAENKFQDITEDFYAELSQLEKRNNSADKGILGNRRQSLNAFTDVKDNESRVEMLKLIQDITRGAKVVVRRMSTKSIHSIIGKSSSLASCMH